MVNIFNDMSNEEAQRTWMLGKNETGGREKACLQISAGCHLERP